MNFDVWSVIWSFLNFFIAALSLFFSVLADKKAQLELADFLSEPTLWKRYQKGINGFLKALDGFFGPVDSLGQGFIGCLRIAFIYPLILLIVSWMLGGEVVVAGVSILPLTEYRLILGFLLLSLGFLNFYYFLKTKHNKIGVVLTKSVAIVIAVAIAFVPTIAGMGAGLIVGFGAMLITFCIVLIEKSISRAVIMLGGALIVLVLLADTGENGAVAIVLAGALAIAGAGAVTRDGTIFGAIAITIVVSIAVAITGAGSSAVFVAGALVVAGALAAANKLYTAMIMLMVITVVDSVVCDISQAQGEASIFIVVIFLFALPIVNALLDQMSLFISRKLIAVIVKDEHVTKWTLVWHLGLDALMAFVFLCLLAAVLAMAVQICNTLYLLTFDWPGMIEQTTADPFGSGLLYTGMLLTTLLPTLFHMMIGAGAIMVPHTPGRWRNRLVTKLKNSPSGWNRLEASFFLCITGAVIVGAVYRASILMVKSIGYLLGEGVELFAPFSRILLNIAMRMRELINHLL